MHVDVFFREIKNEITRNLKKANKNIHIAVAWLTHEDIIRELTQSVESGIDVKIAISDSKENFKNISIFKDYLRLNGKLFVSNESFLHHKFCVIDDSIIINGSYNWSYSACRNEENIMVIKLDRENKEDALLHKKFIMKHKYLCEKCCVQISDIKALNSFKYHTKDRALILAERDETEMRLREDLENDVKNSFEKSRAANISVSSSLLERMKSDGGGVEFIKRLLHDEMTSGDMKTGFNKLEEAIPHRVDLSLEYLVSRPKYETLFTPEEVLFCRKLMIKYDLLNGA